MNFSPSPFWGGVLAVTFYQLIFTNPVSFLSMGLGIVIGCGLTLYTVSQLVIRGYISMTKQVAETLSDAFREHPMVSGIFCRYIGDIFKTFYPTPRPLSSFPTCPSGNTYRPCQANPFAPPTPSPTPSPTPDVDMSAVFDILKGVNISFPPSPPTEEKTEDPVEDGEKAVKPAEEPEVEEKPCEVADEIPESCRGVHDHNGDCVGEPAVKTSPPPSPRSPEVAPKKESAVVSSPPRKRATRSLLSEEPKPSGVVNR